MRSQNMPQKSAEAQICYPSMTIKELEFDQSSRHLKYSILEQRLSTRPPDFYYYMRYSYMRKDLSEMCNFRSKRSTEMKFSK